jgi:hypothetical protein
VATFRENTPTQPISFEPVLTQHDKVRAEYCSVHFETIEEILNGCPAGAQSIRGAQAVLGETELKT